MDPSQGNDQNNTWQRSPASPFPPIESPLKVGVESTNVLYVGLLKATAETVYTVGYRTKTLIREIHVCNKSASDRTFTLRIVPKGETSSDSFAHYCTYPLRTKETVTFHRHTVMLPEWFISVLASNADDIVLSISGVEVLTM